MEKELQNLKTDVWIEARKLVQKHKQFIGEKREYYITLNQLGDILFNACGHACDFTEPYGFVPEAGCPIHDV